jgi:hypothetical protein
MEGKIIVGMKKRSRLILIAVLSFALVMGLAACGGGGANIDEVKAQPYSVDFSGVNPADSGTTYGEAIGNYCPGGKWEQFTAAGGEENVEYTGGDSPEGEVNIQWVKTSSGWSVYAMEIEGEGISMAHINTFFSGAMSSPVAEATTDPAVRELLKNYAASTELSEAKTGESGEYTTIEPGSALIE